ncbi:MAG: glycosyltransferase family 2 protein [Opitutaceae bacterium]
MNRILLITPAHNESQLLHRLLEAVSCQDLLPKEWVIIDDSSTDGTLEIAREFAKSHYFVRLITTVRPGGHSFGSKARAFNFAIQGLDLDKFDFIGNLDADISVSSNYLSSIARMFACNPQLGIAGGRVFTKNGRRFISYDNSLHSVAGAVQMFRVQCFRDIGASYLDLPFGGIDAAAEILARMNGWQVKKNPDLHAYEHRMTGTASTGLISSRYRLGRRFNSLGYSALFQLLRCLSRISDAPPVLGSFAEIVGYFRARISGEGPILEPDVVQFLRSEQRNRLRAPWSQNRQ